MSDDEFDETFMTALADASWMPESPSDAAAKSDGTPKVCASNKTPRVSKVGATDGISKPSFVPQTKARVEPGAAPSRQSEIFDNFFEIRIRNPKISSSTFNIYCEGMRKIRPSQLKPNDAPAGDWITMGVLVGRSEFLKSTNGKEYLYFMLGDLMDCQSLPIKILMFGDCVKEHWKLQLSTAVALISPAYADQDGSRKNLNVVVKLTKPNQLLNLGICPDFSFCKGKKKNGETCRNFVNASISDRCVFHIEACARQFAARRGAFGSTSSVPPRKMEAKNFPNRFSFSSTMVGPQRAARPPAKLLTMADVRRGQKLTANSKRDAEATLKNENEQLNEVLKARADSLGAKNLVKHMSMQQNTIEGNVAQNPLPKVKSFKDFIADKHEKVSNQDLSMPCLGRGLEGSEVFLRSPLKKVSLQQAAADAARRRAVEVLRRKTGSPSKRSDVLQRNVRKRLAECKSPMSGPSNSGDGDASKCGVLKKTKFTDDELQVLLNKKSSHEAGLQKDDLERENTYFNNMEKKEKVETFANTLMEVKNCNVITCKKCKYTSHKQSDYCKINGHLIVRHKANKRFFRCRSCSRRTICYELILTRPCANCGEKDYERVAIRDERKVKLPEEELLLRGEERKYLNK